MTEGLRSEGANTGDQGRKDKWSKAWNRQHQKTKSDSFKEVNQQYHKKEVTFPDM